MVEAGVPALAVVGVVPHEQVEIRRNRRSKVVAGHQCVRLHFRPVRPHPDHSAALQRVARAVRTLGIRHAEIADPDIQPAVDAHPHAIGGVVGPARVFDSPAETLDQQLALVRHPVAIGVAEARQIRRMNQIEIPTHEMTATRAVHARHVIRKPVRPAIAVAVTRDDDFPVILLVTERPVFVHRDIHIPIGGRADPGGVFMFVISIAALRATPPSPARSARCRGLSPRARAQGILLLEGVSPFPRRSRRLLRLRPVGSHARPRSLRQTRRHLLARL
jgi:hypothetical protein